jgi:hypothetical protein
MPNETVSIAYLLTSLLPILVLLVAFIVNIVMGVIALNLAKSRGLNTIVAFFAGFVGSLMTVLIILMLPKKQENQASH